MQPDRLPPPTAVLFDWDNTLVNTWPVIHEALHNTFIEMGHTPWTLAEVKARVKQSMRDSFPALFGDNWPRAAESYQRNYRAIHLDRLQVLPEAERVLDALAARQVFIGLVSNKKGDTLRQEVAHLGWTDRFGSIVGSQDAEFDKPHPAPVHLALAPSGIAPGPHVWFVGDSDVDLEIAEACNLTPVLYGDVLLDLDSPGRFGGFPYHTHHRDHTSFSGWLDDLLR